MEHLGRQRDPEDRGSRGRKGRAARPGYRARAKLTGSHTEKTRLIGAHRGPAVGRRE